MEENNSLNTENQPQADSPIVNQIKTTLEKLAVFIRKDGGDIQFQGFEPKTGTVFVSLTGACQGCMFIDQTMTLGVEAVLQEEVPGVNDVRVIDPSQIIPDPQIEKK